MGKIRITAVVFTFVLFTLSSLFAIPQFGVWYRFPDEIRILSGQEVDLDVGPLFTLEALPPSSVELRLLGWLPVQRADVRVVDRVEVVPGGQAVGILLSARGLLVMRTVAVSASTGARYSPAASAGIRTGDVVVRAGNAEIEHPFELESIVDAYGRRGEAVPITILRQGREIRIDVNPARIQEPGGRESYRLGLYLKDPAAGVGTLTFWEPRTGAYGALGHVIAEGEDAVALNEGRIVSAMIHGVNPGERGRPGEKLGVFESGSSLGSIEKNTTFGIYGHLWGRLPGMSESVPVALSHEIQEGPAEMLTVLEGAKIERFEIQIAAVNPHSESNGRGLVLEVTDPRLLQRTNGIVQGMSGSPILQNGRLVGAVTHVFINNPHRGFGILAEWMVYEAGILSENEEVGRNLLRAVE